jgi:endonuclease/exonuclease/phosphatase family metal-dependent hydrolase
MVPEQQSCVPAQTRLSDVSWRELWHGSVGDMNFKPDSLCYDLMVKGQTDTAHPEHAAGFPAKPHYDDTDFELTTAPLRSAYKEALGAEPQFTNNAQVKQMEPFVECLDYIFVSPQWKVKGTQRRSQRPVPPCH